MVETRHIVEWLQRLVHIPSVGPRSAKLRSGARELRSHVLPGMGEDAAAKVDASIEAAMDKSRGVG